MARIPLTNVSAAMTIRALLIDWDITDSDWECYFGSMPATPSNCIAVLDTGGRIKARLQRTGEAVIGHKVQIKVKSLTYALGFMKAKQIENGLLLGARLKTIEVMTHDDQPVNVFVTSFNLLSPVTPLGTRENKLEQEFSLNGFLNAMEIH